MREPPPGDPDRQAWLEEQWEREERLIERYRQREAFHRTGLVLQEAMYRLRKGMQEFARAVGKAVWPK